MEDFNQRGLDDVRAVLRSAGWSYDSASGNEEHWTRPGKTGGVSASMNTAKNVFHCFTSSDSDFEMDEGYSYFRVYSILEHNGDDSACAKELLERGYGTKHRNDNVNYGESRSNPDCDKVDLSPTDKPEADVIPYEKFPLDKCPPVFRQCVENGLVVPDIDVAYIAIPMLSVIGSSIGMMCGIKISKKLKPLSPTFWVIMIAPPWNGKSISLDMALNKVRELQDNADAEFRNKMRKYRTDLTAYTAKSQKDRGIKPEEPVFREKFYVTNATTEGLNKNLNNNEFGMLYAPDEAAVLLGGMDTYRQSGSKKDMAELNSFFYNKAAHSLRADADRNTSSPNPFVGILGGIPPEELQRYIRKNPSFFSTGFASRCLFVQPEDKTIDVCDDEDIEIVENEIYDYIIEHLWYQRRLHKQRIGTNAEKITPSNPVAITFDAEAMQRYKAYRKSYINQMKTMGSAKRATVGQLLEYCAKIAFVFHVTEWLGSNRGDTLFDDGGNDMSNIPREITSEIAESAFAVTEWLMRHNQSVMSNMLVKFDDAESSLTDSNIEDEIVGIIQSLGGEASLSQISQKRRKWKSESGRSELEKQLSKMVDDGTLVFNSSVGDPWRPKDTYMIKAQK